MGIAEGLLVESEQFAALVPTRDLADALEAWTARPREESVGPLC
jgi:enoyl-CoA hydratase